MLVYAIYSVMLRYLVLSVLWFLYSFAVQDLMCSDEQRCTVMDCRAVQSIGSVYR